MDWCTFFVSALIANIFFWGFICFALKKPQRAGQLLNRIVPALHKIYICAICALIAVGYSYVYIELCQDGDLDEAALNILLIALMIIYGFALSAFVKAGDISSGEEMRTVITLDISIAILCIIGFFWKYKIYSVVTFLIALLIGRYFWFDNVNLQNAVDNIKMIVTALKRQGIIVSLSYFVFLKCLFRMDISDSILYKAIQVISLGSSTVVLSAIALCIGYGLYRTRTNQNKMGNEVEAGNSISKGFSESKK